MLSEQAWVITALDHEQFLAVAQGQGAGGGARRAGGWNYQWSGPSPRTGAWL